MKKALLFGTALALGPMAALAADLAPAPRLAPAPVAVAYNPWGGFYGGFSVGWNWGDGTTVTAPQAAAGQPGFYGDTFAGPAFIEAQNRFNAQNTACDGAANCTATDNVFGLPSVGFLGREQEKGGAVITLNAGYNWQFGNLVFGVETDLSALNRRYESAFAGTGASGYQFDYATVIIPGDPTADPPTVDTIIPGSTINGVYTNSTDFATRSRMHWLSTARLRAGFAAGDFLIYATGGLAAGRGSMSASGRVVENFTETTTPTGGVATTTYSASSTTTWAGRTGGGTDFGYAIGGGVEWMTGRGFSLKAEYLYYDLGDQTLLATGTTTTTVNGQTTTAAAPTVRIRQNLDGHIFRVGLNFGFPVAARGVAPVVAAY